MTLNRHRIQRQVLELTVGDAAAAPGIQEQLARACREPLLAGMTSVFDSVAPAHELLRLERLEIDVGRIEGDDWAPEFERRLLAELERLLESHATEAKRERATEISEADGGEFEAFVFFLRHGRLPWWGSAPDSGWSRTVEAADARRIEVLRALLHEEPRALTRLINALDDEALDTLAAGTGSLQDCTPALRELRPSDSAASNHRWRLKFWSAVIAWSIAPRDGGTGAGLVHALLAERCMLAMEQSRQRLDVASGSTGSGSAAFIRPVTVAALPALWREWCEAAFKEMEHAAPTAPSVGEVVQAASASGHPQQEPRGRGVESSAIADQLVRAGSASDRQRQESRQRKVESATGEVIYLPCVGILLLHPFLETLFRDRGLLEGNRFVDDEARQRGAQLLGYIATGRADTPEYELGFAKLLVDLAIETPLESAWLEPSDIAACDALLAAVLGHWTALRSSSAAWLRSQFFLRDGKLEAVDGGHRITVERRAQDVLLARLPWGFGVISLPWREQRIFVQWLD
jgi:hypothetical protein